MMACGLVLLLVGSALSAPQGESKDIKIPKVRQLDFGQGEPIIFQSSPQFGAKLAPAGGQVVYLQGGYQQPQYTIPGSQQVAYISGAPSQTFVSGAPAQTYFTGQYSQPQANLITLKKKVKPAVYKFAAAPPAQFRPSVVPVFKSPAPAAAITTYKAPLPAPAPVYKVSAAPAPPTFKVSGAPAPVQYSSSFSAEPNHVIVKQVQDDNFDGSFSYSFETDHGISVDSSGFLKNAGTEDEIQVIQGSYTYYSPEGVPIVTTYIADENGFQVQGDHLPVAPPLPEAIAKSIEYQRSLPPSPEDLVEDARQ